MRSKAWSIFRWIPDLTGRGGGRRGGVLAVTGWVGRRAGGGRRRGGCGDSGAAVAVSPAATPQPPPPPPPHLSASPPPGDSLGTQSQTLRGQIWTEMSLRAGVLREWELSRFSSEKTVCISVVFPSHQTVWAEGPELWWRRQRSSIVSPSLTTLWNVMISTSSFLCMFVCLITFCRISLEEIFGLVFDLHWHNFT